MAASKSPFGYGPKCQGWLQQLNHKGNHGAASASRSWYFFCQNGHGLQDWLAAPLMHSNCTMKLSNIQISRFKKTKKTDKVTRHAWFHQIWNSRKKEGGMGPGKILCHLSSPRPKLHCSKVLRGYSFSVWFGSYLLLAPNHPPVLAQRTWKKENFCPLKFDYSKWNEIKEDENRGPRLTFSSKPMKIKKNWLSCSLEAILNCGIE